MNDSGIGIEEILNFLNRTKTRATYSAVGEVLGIPAKEVSNQLGPRSRRASWVVSTRSGKPTGYDDSDLDPALFTSERILSTGSKVYEAMASATAGVFRNQAFTVSHGDRSPFEGEGLRPFFEYRNLGIADATHGRFGAHVIRAVPGRHSEARWHVHDLDFQMVYVTRGWVIFEYEGRGETILRAGSCVIQPPGIRHREVHHSDDMELIEIVSPAEFGTTEVLDPEAAANNFESD